MAARVEIFEDPDFEGKVLRVLHCPCGTNFEILDWFMDDCPSCGQLYNGAGQALRPMDQWGEETGESLADIFDQDPEWPDQRRF